VFELFVLGAGDEPDLVATLFEGGDQLLRPRERVTILLQLLVGFRVEALDLLRRLFIIDELLDQEPGTFTHLPVELDPRHPMAGPLESPRPRLRVQVIGVHQRAVYVQNDHFHHLDPFRALESDP
jgi:hypothetical protein